MAYRLWWQASRMAVTMTGSFLYLGRVSVTKRHHGIVDGHAGHDAIGTVDILGQHVIGDDHAVAAPLVAQDAGDQTVVAAGPDSTPSGCRQS